LYGILTVFVIISATAATDQRQPVGQPPLSLEGSHAHLTQSTRREGVIDGGTTDLAEHAMVASAPGNAYRLAPDSEAQGQFPTRKRGRKEHDTSWFTAMGIRSFSDLRGDTAFGATKRTVSLLNSQ